MIMHEIVEEGFALDVETGLYLVFVGGELRAAAHDQTEAAKLYEEVRK